MIGRGHATVNAVQEADADDANHFTVGESDDRTASAAALYSMKNMRTQGDRRDVAARTAYNSVTHMDLTNRM